MAISMHCLESVSYTHLNSPIKSLNRLINTTQNVKISITDSATQAIANEAIQKDTGARSLNLSLIHILWNTKGCDHQKDHIGILCKTCIAHSKASDNIGKGTLVQKTDHLGDHKMCIRDSH